MTFENQPVNTGPVNPPPTSGLAIAALVIGILSMIFAVVVFPLGAIGGVIGVILGFVARSKIKRGEAAGGGLAIGGIITSLLAIVIAVLVGTVLVTLFDRFVDCADPNLSQSEVEECVEGQLTGG